MKQHLSLSVISGVIILGSVSLVAQNILFDPAAKYATGHIPEALAVGDLNLDGVPDVVIANTSSDGEPGGNGLSVLLGKGDGSFDVLGVFPAGSRPEGVALGLFNDDESLDAVTADFGGSTVSILDGDGEGGFAAPRVIVVPGGPRFVVTADFDGDGHLDLATSNFSNDTVSILKGAGDGTFAITKSFAVGDGPEVIAVGRFTDDAHLDLVTVDALGDTVTALAGDGNGDFTVGELHMVGENPRFVVTQDLDGDGFDDLIVANNDSNTLTIERSDGALGFETVATLSVSIPASAIHFLRPVYITLADMNNDGRLDILTTWGRSGTQGWNVFTIFRKTAGPAFEYETTPSASTTGETPLGIAALDLNGDGHLDVVISNAFEDTASVFLTYAGASDVIIDNGDPGTTPIGPWPLSGTQFQHGPDSLTSKDGPRYMWEADLPDAGAHEVLVWWTVTSSRSQSVPIEVRHADGASTLLVDQTKDIGIWHSLGIFDFRRSATVILTCPNDGGSGSVDAVRFRPISDPQGNPPRGRVPVNLHSRPKSIQIDDDTVLALQGTLAADNSNESEDWVAAIVTPVGSGSESARITACRLYIDSNGNGLFDPADAQLGDDLTFGSDVRSVTFDGFLETLTHGVPVTFFVTADLVPGPAVASARREPVGRENALLASSAAIALIVLLLGRRRPLALGLAALLLLPVLFLTGPGCSSGGGGNGSGGDLKLELSTVVTRGTTTGTPSTVEDLPAKGWGF
ncbi:MAG TPA: FG-GAP-like repeat-containing protein [Planctomycetota bacterium]|nr:FG-GAP-like repeat-containing protein [Planctomycetota bacterium]